MLFRSDKTRSGVYNSNHAQCLFPSQKPAQPTTSEPEPLSRKCSVELKCRTIFTLLPWKNRNHILYSLHFEPYTRTSNSPNDALFILNWSFRRIHYAPRFARTLPTTKAAKAHLGDRRHVLYGSREPPRGLRDGGWGQFFLQSNYQGYVHR